MKRFSRLMAVAVLVLMCGAVFGACSWGSPLKTPENLIVIGRDLVWNSVDKADQYVVDINGTTLQTKNNKVYLIDHLVLGENQIKVQAVPRWIDLFHKESAFSTELIFTISQALGVPSNVRTEETELTVALNWDSVPNAGAYEVQMVFNQPNTYAPKTFIVNTTSADIEQYAIPAGLYTLKVRALPASADAFLPGAYSDGYVWAYSAPLKTPSVDGMNLTRGNGGQYTLSFNAVSGAADYVISTLGSNATITTLQTSNVNVTSLFAGLPSSPARFVCVMARAEAGSYYSNSSFSDFVSNYHTGSLGSLSAYQALTFDLYGETIKTCVSSQAEFNALCTWAVYNRITQFHVVVNYSVKLTIAKMLVLEPGEALHNAIMSYPEILDLGVITGRVADYGKSGTHRVSLAFNNPSDPQTRQTGNYSITQREEVKSHEYSGTAVTSFAIDSATKSRVVYNSEQLFWCVQEGYKPIFITEQANSAVAKIYSRARQALSEMLTTEMTQYDIAHVIFDYVVYTVKYDYNLLENPKPSAGTFDNRGFYLDGVFLDDGTAVCDGIAKAYSLMCNIAGVECYKVNGYAGTGIRGRPQDFASSGHAWNKVNIIVDAGSSNPNYSTKNWYVVDATWADVTREIGNKYNKIETLTHRYFLVTDQSIYNDHYEQYPNKNVALTTFDYYGFTEYSAGNNLRLTTGDLSAIMAYLAIDDDVNSIEFYVGSFYLSELISACNTALGSAYGYDIFDFAQIGSGRFNWAIIVVWQT